MSLPTFVTDEPFHAPSTVTLGEDAAHHMRVRRLETGTHVRLLDGAGVVGYGPITQLAKRHASVSVERTDDVEPPAPIHLMLPVADKDRMLWLAEKATELGVASWRPVVWKRSKHVSPRGEGTTFHQKVRARMVSALEQSGSAWLPMLYPEATPAQAMAARPEGLAVVLDAGAPPILNGLVAAQVPGAVPAVTIAVGPEGGFEPDELHALMEAGFVPASLGDYVLRFETAGVAGIAAVRAALEAWQGV